MWQGFSDAYFCIPPSAAGLAQAIWSLDTARDYRINAIVYGVLEGGVWTPFDQNWRDWFRANFGLTFVPAVPPENSYFTLNPALWSQIYDMMDAGHFPDQEVCWLLRFPASQGGSWPILWP